MESKSQSAWKVGGPFSYNKKRGERKKKKNKPQKTKGWVPRLNKGMGKFNSRKINPMEKYERLEQERKKGKRKNE